jgi:hypothetical protein
VRETENERGGYSPSRSFAPLALKKLGQERVLALLERHGFLTAECYYLGFGSNPRACIARLRDKGYRITTLRDGVKRRYALNSTIPSEEQRTERLERSGVKLMQKDKLGEG